MSLKDQILEIDDLPNEEVTVPEWKGLTLLVRSLDGGQRAEFHNRFSKEAQRAARLQKAGQDVEADLDLAELYGFMLTRCLFDPATKEPVFGAGEVDGLLKKNGAVLDRLTTLAMKVSGLAADNDKDPVEVAAGNSSETPIDSSSSS